MLHETAIRLASPLDGFWRFVRPKLQSMAPASLKLSCRVEECRASTRTAWSRQHDRLHEKLRPDE
jgi:hypothetical protein